MKMLNLKKITYSIMILMSASNSQAWINIKSFEEEISAVKKNFKEIRKEMLKDFKNEFKNTDPISWKVVYESGKDNTDLKIIVTGVDTHNIDSQLSDDASRLSIALDGGVIVIKTLKNWISLTLEQGIEHRDQTKSGTTARTSINSLSSSQTLAHTIDLQNTDMSYTASEKKLIIAVPYKKLSLSSKKIPVKMQ